MNSEGKTSDQLEKEGGTTGNICDELPDGKKFCLQVAPPFFDDDVFYLFLQKQNLGAKLHIYL
jgi:hypothetical protein